MIQSKKSIRAFGALLLLLAVSPMAMAQATRTWVSGVGDDANPCSRTAPCKTFAGAISKTAAGGVINTLDPGGFGAVTITKSITISGSAGGGILSAASNGITINAAPTDIIIITDMNIEGGGSGLNGIRFLAGGTLTVLNTRITGHLTGDTTQGRGILFVPVGPSKLFVRNLVSANNVGGILISPGPSGSATVDIDNANLSNNINGIRIGDRSVAAIHNSVFTGNTSNAIVVSGTSAFSFLNLDNTHVASNGASSPSAAGIAVEGGSAVAWLSNNVFTDNPVGLKTISGGTLVSFGNNRVSGNGTDGSPTSTISTR